VYLSCGGAPLLARQIGFDGTWNQPDTECPLDTPDLGTFGSGRER
jgi:hypothetical protein